VERQQVLHISMCVRARLRAFLRVYVGARECRRVYVRAPVAFVIQHAARMRHILLLFVASLSPLHYLVHGTTSEKKNIEIKMYPDFF
jgi:hypothetical protein